MSVRLSSSSTATDVVRVTTVTGSPVVNHRGELLGRLEDIVVKLAEGVYPLVSGVVVNLDDHNAFVDIKEVDAIKPGEIRLAGDSVSHRTFERRPGGVLLVEDILGRHLVDVAAGRIIRAYDLVLQKRDAHWYLIGVQRRPQPRLSRLLQSSRPTIRMLDWKDVQPFVAHVPSAKLSIPLRRLRPLHPAQIADLVEQSSHEEGKEIIAAVEADQELEADVFEEMDTTHQLEFLKSRSNEEVATLLARMQPDDAADLLLELDQERRKGVFDLLPPQHKEKLRALLMYHPSSAGGMMHPDLIAVRAGTTVHDALEEVKRHPKSLPHLRATIFVVDVERHLIGCVFTADLLSADAAKPIDAVEALNPVAVRTDADVSEASLVMADYNLVALPVVDADGKLVGAVTADDVVEALVPDNWRRREEASAGE